jgi:hypothetical protein
MSALHPWRSAGSYVIVEGGPYIVAGGEQRLEIRNEWSDDVTSLHDRSTWGNKVTCVHMKRQWFQVSARSQARVMMRQHH